MVPAALTVRGVAREAGTTTRAVYSVFGSRDGLLVDAVAQGAFEFLFERIGALEETDDPVADLIDLGLNGFRPLVLEHPALYRIAFQRAIPGMQAGPELTAARTRAWNQLVGQGRTTRSRGLARREVGARGCGRVQRDARGPGECRATRSGAQEPSRGRRGAGVA